MMVDHVAYTVPENVLQSSSLAEFMEQLGFREFRASPEYQAKFMDGYEARWWTNGGECDVHLVAGQRSTWGLNHFCLKGVGLPLYRALQDSIWLDRDSGSGRLWLVGPGGLRVEVHP